MEAVTVQALTTVAGLSAVTVLIVFILQRALNLTGEVMDRFGPLISVVIAIILALVASLTLGIAGGADLLQGVLNGLFAGLTASGGYDVLNGLNKAATKQS